jgi:hypothetical protein
MRLHPWTIRIDYGAKRTIPSAPSCCLKILVDKQDNASVTITNNPRYPTCWEPRSEFGGMQYICISHALAI